MPQNRNLFLRAAVLVLWWLCNVLPYASSLSSGTSMFSSSNFFPSPSDNKQANLEKEGNAGVANTVSLPIRIRSTTASDITDGISGIWAEALADTKSPTDSKPRVLPIDSLSRKIQIFQFKTGVEKLLKSRFKAITLWHQLMEECATEYEGVALTESERLRYVWSTRDGGFQTTLEQAAELSREPHKWKSYNFACAPTSWVDLQHKMLTAKDTKTGNIVGFCEIAMLLEPSSGGSHTNPVDTEPNVKPTIVNLVVASEARRQGVASRLVQSARTYVRHQWQASDLNLYVDKENKAAIRLYERLNFERRMEVQQASGASTGCEQWYMTLPLESYSRTMAGAPSKGFEFAER